MNLAKSERKFRYMRFIASKGVESNRPVKDLPRWWIISALTASRRGVLDVRHRGVTEKTLLDEGKNEPYQTERTFRYMRFIASKGGVESTR